jgi:hypothetical protein
MLFRLFTLCSARVSALVIVLNDSPCEIIGKWEAWPILKEKIFGAHLAGASVTKAATSLGVSRATLSEVMSACTNHGKTISGKRNSGQKSTLTERDCQPLRRNVSKNHTTTAAQATGQHN